MGDGILFAPRKTASRSGLTLAIDKGGGICSASTFITPRALTSASTLIFIYFTVFATALYGTTVLKAFIFYLHFHIIGNVRGITSKAI